MDIRENMGVVDYFGEKRKAHGILAFAASLLNVSEFQILPKMIKPLTLDELTSYIVPIAEKLIRQLRPEGTG